MDSPAQRSCKPSHVSESPARSQRLTQARVLHTGSTLAPCSAAKLLPRGNQGDGSLFAHSHCLGRFCAITEHLLHVHCTGHGWCHPYWSLSQMRKLRCRRNIHSHAVRGRGRIVHHSSAARPQGCPQSTEEPGRDTRGHIRRGLCAAAEQAQRLGRNRMLPHHLREKDSQGPGQACLPPTLASLGLPNKGPQISWLKTTEILQLY